MAPHIYIFYLYLKNTKVGGNCLDQKFEHVEFFRIWRDPAGPSSEPRVPKRQRMEGTDRHRLP